MKSAVLALAAARLATVEAAPLEGPKPPYPIVDGFSLNQIQNEAFVPLDGPSALIRAHMKYANALPQRLIKAIEVNPSLYDKFHEFLADDEDEEQRGSVINYPSPWYDTEYVAPVQVGTPPQTIYLNMDTGSADFWTFTTDTYPPQVQGQILYDPSASNTSSRLSGQSWSIRYGDGAYAAGIVYQDRVSVGGTYVNQQAVQSAIQVSTSISRDAFSSGIMGMGRGHGNTVRPTQQKTYLENVRDSLARPVFTSNLQKGRPGNYDFGYINRTLYNGDVHYLKARANSTFWQVDVPGYQIGRNGTYHNQTWNAIVDTGTTLFLAPESIVDAYYAQVDGAGWDMFSGMVTFPCNAVLPDFYFGIGSWRGRLPGSYVNYGRSDNNFCYGGIQSSQGIPFSVIGDVLLKAQFVVFDMGEERVGFANKDLVPSRRN